MDSQSRKLFFFKCSVFPWRFCLKIARVNGPLEHNWKNIIYRTFVLKGIEKHVVVTKDDHHTYELGLLQATEVL